MLNPSYQLHRQLSTPFIRIFRADKSFNSRLNFLSISRDFVAKRRKLLPLVETYEKWRNLQTEDFRSAHNDFTEKIYVFRFQFCLVIRVKTTQLLNSDSNSEYYRYENSFQTSRNNVESDKINWKKFKRKLKLRKQKSLKSF